MKIDPGSAPQAPAGFRFSGVAAGIKKSRRRDIALIVADQLAACAAVFTRNTAAAAPVLVAREHCTSGRARAILINSGNANAATGAQGLATTRWSCRELARGIKARTSDVVPCSTGVIGVQLDRSALGRGITKAVAALDRRSLPNAARAIMTSDAFEKWEGCQVELSSGVVRLAAFAKGAGMIEPNMATMLSFLLTDAALSPQVAKRILARAVRQSFNRISVDGDTSTNDTALVMASGAADGASLVKSSGADYELFAEAACAMCRSLARKIVCDGEGTRKVVDIIVQGAANDASAERGVRAIANSTLMKCALAGADPNWGRILMALGNTDVAFNESTIAIEIAGVRVVKSGRAPSTATLREASRSMKADSFSVCVKVGNGPGSASILTCDLTGDYVHFNSAYTT